MAGTMPKTMISYCPDFDQYHYRKGEGEAAEEYYFDTSRLKQVIASYGEGGNHQEAEILAFVSGLARNIPHRELTINSDGKVDVSPPRAVKLEESSRPGD